MTLAEVNVLVYAFRPDAPQHRASRNWLESVVRSDARYGVSPLALGALVRITTSKRAFPNPTPLAEAFAFCERLLSGPNAVIIEPGARHWRLFERLCRNDGIVGPRVTEAWCAALAIEHDCVFITFDRDYARFPGLDLRAPG